MNAPEHLLDTLRELHAMQRAEVVDVAVETACADAAEEVVPNAARPAEVRSAVPEARAGAPAAACRRFRTPALTRACPIG